MPRAVLVLCLQLFLQPLLELAEGCKRRIGVYAAGRAFGAALAAIGCLPCIRGGRESRLRSCGRSLRCGCGGLLCCWLLPGFCSGVSALAAMFVAG